jgi:proline dehydrogenase
MPPDRWTLPDLPSAISLAKARNRQGIRCTLATLDEYATTKAQAFAAVKDNVACLRAIAAAQLDASLSVKLTAIGASFDQALCREYFGMIAKEAASQHLGIELDMEGRSFVEFTIETGLSVRGGDVPMTIALQAYLDRTPRDLLAVTAQGARVRLVKGAYLGDTGNYAGIQHRFRDCALGLVQRDLPFSAGTHDTELLDWIRDELPGAKVLVELGFLKGLSDETKERLAKEGWSVAEYVPFGAVSGPYISRREKYLRDLEAAGRSPAP